MYCTSVHCTRCADCIFQSLKYVLYRVYSAYLADPDEAMGGLRGMRYAINGATPSSLRQSCGNKEDYVIKSHLI